MNEAEIYKYQKQQQIDLIWEQLKILKPYLEDEKLTDIMINQNGRIFLDSKDGMIETDVYIDEYKRNSIADLLAGYNKKILNESKPMLSGKLPSGERIEIVTGEVTGYKTTISIRIPNKNIISLNELVEMGSMTKLQKEYLEYAIKNKKNIILFGGTGTGKTTIINSLISELYGSKERIMIVEEVPELIINEEKLANLTRYVTTEHVKAVDILKSLMRQRPDRIIYGELRWGYEVETYLDGLNTGHKGGITSNHANSAIDGLYRLEELLTEVEGKTQPRPYMVARGIDVAIHVKRETLENGKPRRFINEIIEVNGYKNGEYIYKEIEKI